MMLTLGYFYFFAPKPPEKLPEEVSVETPINENESPDSNSTVVDSEIGGDVAGTISSDSLELLQLKDKYSDFYQVVEGEGEIIKVVTDQLTLEINTKGGAIQAAYLNDFKTFDSLPLPIVAPNPNNEFYFEFGYKNRALKSSDLVFKPSEKNIQVHGENTKVLSLKAAIDADHYIEQIYSFKGNTYDLGYEVKMKGLRKGLGNSTFYELHWLSNLPKTELAIENMRQKSSIVYRLGDDVEKMSPSDDPEKEKLGALVEWVSYKSQFFSQILIAEKPLRSGSVEMTTPNNEQINRVMSSKLIVDVAKENEVSQKFRFFLGPNEYALLEGYDLKLEEQLDLGWWIVGYINIGTTYIFTFLEKYIDNYGIIVIILAFIFRMAVFPLTYKSFVSMAKMRVLNNTPEMKALDEKHKGDAQKLQMAKMGIYKEMGVSMFGGCLPMLFSYPFLIALFFFFPQSVELRQESFLWATDLSTYDSILDLPFKIPAYGDHVSLFTLLMAISTMVYTYFQQKSQPTSGANAQFKYIIYFMPVVLLIFLNNYASGLSLYYFTSNIVSIAQTTGIRYFLDDKKILEEMRVTQKNLKGKKGKKASKGKIQKWMEAQQKKQEAMMKEKRKNEGTNRSARKKK